MFMYNTPIMQVLDVSYGGKAMYGEGGTIKSKKSIVISYTVEYLIS